MNFKEARLVFQHADEGGADIQNHPTNYYDPVEGIYYDAVGVPTSITPEQWAEEGEEIVAAQEAAAQARPEAPAAAAAAARETGGEQVQAATEHAVAGEKEKLETVKSLGALKDVLKEDFKTVAEVLNGKRLRGEIKVDQIGEGFAFLGIMEAFQSLVKERFSKEDLDKLRPVFARFFEFEDSEFPDLLANLGAASMLTDFRDQIQKRYEHILTFEPFVSGKFDLAYDVAFRDGEIAMSVTLPSGVQDQYQKHAEAKAAETKAAEEQAAAAKRQETAEEQAARIRQEKIDQLKAHPIGSVFVDFFGGKGPNGEPSLLDNLLDGKSPILAFLLGALGVGGFSKAYDSAKKLAEKNPKLKGIFDQIEARVKPYRTEVSAPEAAAGGVEAAPTYPQIDAKKFGEFVSPKAEVGAKGLQLKEAFTIPRGKKLKVDLKGGSLIIPRTTSLNLEDGKTLSPESGKTLEVKDAVYVLVQAIPKETIFKRGVKFELV